MNNFVGCCFKAWANAGRADTARTDTALADTVWTIEDIKREVYPTLYQSFVTLQE